jgi:Bifunctional DNA primase/polymerase, N-terminal
MSAISSATDLAERGFSAFPCLSTKAPATPSGFRNATSDPDGVRELWRRWPGPLIGVPTGAGNGFDVLDIDPRHGGDTWHAAHRDNLPDTRIHTTRSGGLHILFRHLDGVRNSAGKIAPGIDVRGEGGFVIWWPAAGCPEMARGAPSDWPAWLHPLVLREPGPKPNGTATIPRQQTDQLRFRYRRFAEKLLENVLNATDGQKHDTLLRTARTLGGIIAAAGVTAVEAHGWLMAALPQSSTLNIDVKIKTAWAGLKCGMAEPFDLEERPWQRT